MNIRESRNTHSSSSSRSSSSVEEGEAEGAGGWGKTDPPWATFPRSHEWTRVATRFLVGELTLLPLPSVPRRPRSTLYFIFLPFHQLKRDRSTGRGELRVATVAGGKELGVILLLGKDTTSSVQGNFQYFCFAHASCNLSTIDQDIILLRLCSKDFLRRCYEIRQKVSALA